MTAPRIAAALAAAWATLLLGAPRVALACSVCSAGRDDETRAAFIATTALLTLLPLAMVGGLVWWLRRRALEVERAERAALEAGPELPAELAPASRTSSSR